MSRSGIVCVAVVVTAVWVWGVPAQAQLVVDDFDDYPAGLSPPAPWWYWGTSGTILVDDTVYHGTGGSSIEFNRVMFDYQPFTIGQAVMPPLEGQGEMTYSFRLGGGSDREVLCVFGHNYDNNAVAWWVTHGGWFGNAVATYSNSQGWTHVMDVVDDTWYSVRLDIDVDTHSYDITVWEDDDPTNTATVTGLDFRDLAAADPIDDIQMGDFYDSFSITRTAYLDDVRLIGPRIFADDFEAGNTGAWSNGT
jgi:hypothetical protein